MSNIRLVNPPKSKSKQIIMDCVRRVFKLVTKREITLIAIVMIDANNNVHLDRIGPVTWAQTDQMLEGLEQLHEDIYLALRDQ